MHSVTRQPTLFSPASWSRRARWRVATVSALGLLVALAIAGGVWWTAQDEDSGPVGLRPEAVIDPPFDSLTYGIHTFLWWNPTTRTIDLDNVRQMNFTHVKQRFSWANIEPLRDQWDWSKADGVVDEAEYRGLQVVARLDGPPEWAHVPFTGDKTVAPIDLDAWGTFCGTLAGRYQGRIAAYQVWNEPNLSREWLDRPVDATGYVKLLRACTEAIRAADPDAIVISAALAPTGTWTEDVMPDDMYLRAMYDAGARPWFDVLGLNAPGYKSPPSLSPDEAFELYGQRWMCFRHVEDMRRIMVEEGDAAKQVALLEVGWTIDPRPDSPYNWHAVSPYQQAVYLAGAYRFAAEHWRPWVGLIVTIYMADITWTEDDEEYWWAINTAGYLVDSDRRWESRPAYILLANMEKVMGDMVIPAETDWHLHESTHITPLPERDPADE